MAIQHVDITDPDIHEPKGASTASAGSGYFSDGAGSGTWTKVGSANLDTASVNSYIQTQIDQGNISARRVNYVTARLENVSASSSVLLPILEAGTITRIQVVFTSAITGSDPTITFLN